MGTFHPSGRGRGEVVCIVEYPLKMDFGVADLPSLTENLRIVAFVGTDWAVSTTVSSEHAIATTEVTNLFCCSMSPMIILSWKYTLVIPKPWTHIGCAFLGSWNDSWRKAEHLWCSISLFIANLGLLTSFSRSLTSISGRRASTWHQESDRFWASRGRSRNNIRKGCSDTFISLSMHDFLSKSQRPTKREPGISLPFAVAGEMLKAVSNQFSRGDFVVDALTTCGSLDLGEASKIFHKWRVT